MAGRGRELNPLRSTLLDATLRRVEAVFVFPLLLVLFGIF